MGWIITYDIYTWFLGDMVEDKIKKNGRRQDKKKHYMNNSIG